MLDSDASQHTSVEINYTFRRFPSEKTLLGWKELAADGFVFTLKANQRITHWMKLNGVQEPVKDFMERAKLLGDRLGCVLFQCPPNLEYDRTRIEAFVETLPQQLD